MFFVFRCSGQPDMMHHASYLRQRVAIEHGRDRYSTHGLPGANYSSISALKKNLLSTRPIRHCPDGVVLFNFEFVWIIKIKYKNPTATNI